MYWLEPDCWVPRPLSKHRNIQGSPFEKMNWTLHRLRVASLAGSHPGGISLSAHYQCECGKILKCWKVAVEQRFTIRHRCLIWWGCKWFTPGVADLYLTRLYRFGSQSHRRGETKDQGLFHYPKLSSKLGIIRNFCQLKSHLQAKSRKEGITPARVALDTKFARSHIFRDEIICIDTMQNIHPHRARNQTLPSRFQVLLGLYW